MSDAVPLRRIRTSVGDRRPSGLAELDSVLGGGAVPGSSILIGGEPGIGKSTLLLQMTCRAQDEGRTCLYVAGEEAPEQIARRARRLGFATSDLLILDSLDARDIAQSIQRHHPWFCVVDSVQALRLADINGVPGGPAQVRAATAALTEAARGCGTALFLVGQVTKVGGLAGPRFLEHAVDCVVLFEGERNLALRTLRVVKNRFGATDEVGLFEMTERGLVEVRNASRLLLDRHRGGPGCAVAAVAEGRRTFCVEVQVLLVGGGSDRALGGTGGARRRAQGVDPRRVELLAGVVQSFFCPEIAGRDVFLNVVGGVTIRDTGLDLAVAAALLGAEWGRPLPLDAVTLGEVGLRGEVRPVPRTAPRLKEAKALGFRHAFVPPGAPTVEGILTHTVERVHDLWRQEDPDAEHEPESAVDAGGHDAAPCGREPPWPAPVRNKASATRDPDSRS